MSAGYLVDGTEYGTVPQAARAALQQLEADAPAVLVARAGLELELTRHCLPNGGGRPDALYALKAHIKDRLG